MASSNQNLEVITYGVVLKEDTKEVLNLLRKDFLKVNCKFVGI